MTACSSCRFYRGATVGACYRYPSPTRVSSSHWCGEFAAVDLPKVDPIVSKKGKSRLNFRPLPAAENGDKL